MEPRIDPDARYNDKELAALMGIGIDGLRRRRARGGRTPKTMKNGQLNRTFGSAILEYFEGCDTTGGDAA